MMKLRAMTRRIGMMMVSQASAKGNTLQHHFFTSCKFSFKTRIIRIVTNTHRFDKEVDTTNDHGCDVNQYKKNWTKASVPVAFFHLAWSDVNQPHCSYVDQVKSSTGLNIFCINGRSIYNVIQIWDERPSPHVVL